MKFKIIKICVVFLLIVSVTGLYEQRSQTKDLETVVEDVEPDLPEAPMATIDTYFPLIKDTVWKFKGDNYTKNTMVWIEFIRDNVFQIRFKNGQNENVKVYLKENGALYEVASIEDVSVKADYTNFRQYKDLVFKVPVEVGESWTLHDGSTRVVENIDLTMDTKLGEVQAIEIVTYNDEKTITAYFSERLGLIKQVIEVDDEIISYEISELLEDEPVNQEIKVYLADVNTYQLLYEVQQIPVRTNEEARHFLTDVLKKVPTEEFIIPLSMNAFISAIYSDEENNQIYVDMSKEYYEMNYGAGFEYAAIQSLITTIGAYYDVENVILAVEGEPYSSGHIAFEIGEKLVIQTENINEIQH